MRFVAAVAVVPLAALLSAGNCSTSRRPPPVGDGNGNNAARVCTLDDTTLARPSTIDGDDQPPVVEAASGIDLSCIGNPVVLAQSAAVTVQGCIDIFGIGDRAKRGIKVAIFSEEQDLATEAPEFGEVDVAVEGDSTTLGLDCVGADANAAACRALSCESKGAYAFDNVPVHVPVTMLVHAPGDDTVIATYSFGVVFDYLNNAAVDGVVEYEANLIYSSTWSSIPTVGGQLIDGGSVVGDGQGRAVIAGEIHDCSDNLIKGASVTSDQVDSSTRVTYFDGDLNDPAPDQKGLSTDVDGLYVILNANTASGKDVHTVTAGVLEPGCAGEDCQCVSLGSRTIRTFPDSVSVVTLRGDFPTLQ